MKTKIFLITFLGLLSFSFIFFQACKKDNKKPSSGTSTVTDADGNVYNTVQIGNQCWMKENLKVGTRINGSQNMSDNGFVEKYCYNNDPANCDVYGGLYQWDEMVQ